MTLSHLLLVCTVLTTTRSEPSFTSHTSDFLSGLIKNADPYHQEHDEKILSRQKRYIVFPEGSEFSLAFCMSFKTLGTDDIFTGGMNLAVAYELPNETIHNKGSGQFLDPPPVLLRRHRRDLYRKMEIVFDSVGVDGRACMLRTLCEAAQRLIPRGSLISELLRVLFTLPLERVRSYEPDEHRLYDAAHREGHAAQDCPTMFPNCPLSVLDMALGAFRT